MDLMEQGCMIVGYCAGQYGPYEEAVTLKALFDAGEYAGEAQAANMLCLLCRAFDTTCDKCRL